jgi:hypothetical protein
MTFLDEAAMPERIAGALAMMTPEVAAIVHSKPIQ